MIKTILFDLGNVILPFDVTRLARRLTAFSSLKTEEIVKKLWNDHIAEPFETGRMSPDEYFTHISEACGFQNFRFDDFLPLFNEIFDEDKAVVELIINLKNNYKLGLISNTNAIHVTYIKSNFPQLGHFDRHFFSNEVGYRKPHEAIYRLALDHFNSNPQETLFIDDYEINVAAARQLGIHAIHYKGVDHLKENLSQMGIKY